MIGSTRRRAGLAFCWVHVRRNFYRLATPAPRGLPAKRFSALPRCMQSRKTSAAAVPKNFAWFGTRRAARLSTHWSPGARETQSDQPKGHPPEAINYALSRWEGLTRFLDDGHIEFDNNTVERSIRRIVRGLRRRSRALGHNRLAHRDLHTQRRRPARLSHRCSSEDRQRSPQPRYRRPFVVGSPKARPQGRGLRTTLALISTTAEPLPYALIAIYIVAFRDMIRETETSREQRV